MNEEGGAAIDAGFEDADAFFGSIPTLDYDVIQLVAQKLVDHSFVRTANLDEVGQGAYGGHSVGEGSRLQETAHRFGGVTVISDQGIEGVAPANCGGMFAAELVSAGTQGILFATTSLQGFAQLGNFGLETL